MSVCYKAYTLAFAVALALVLCVSAIAQQSADLITSNPTGSAPVPQQATSADDNNWHLAISPYLWFAGVHGTVGAWTERSASMPAPLTFCRSSTSD